MHDAISDENLWLITRSDLDGVETGGLLIEQSLTRDDIIFAEPREIQHGRSEVTNRDITANLTYAMIAHRCFDRHVSETVPVACTANLIIDPNAP